MIIVVVDGMILGAQGMWYLYLNAEVHHHAIQSSYASISDSAMKQHIVLTAFLIHCAC